MLSYGEGSQSGVCDKEQRHWDFDYFLLHCFKDNHRLLSVTQYLSLVVQWLSGLLSDI